MAVKIGVKVSLALKTDGVAVLKLNTAPVFLAHRKLMEEILLFENDELFVSDYIEKTSDYQTSLRLSYGKH